MTSDVLIRPSFHTGSSAAGSGPSGGLCGAGPLAGQRSAGSGPPQDHTGSSGPAGRLSASSGGPDGPAEPPGLRTGPRSDLQKAERWVIRGSEAHPEHSAQ